MHLKTASATENAHLLKPSLSYVSLKQSLRLQTAQMYHVTKVRSKDRKLKVKKAIKRWPQAHFIALYYETRKKKTSCSRIH